MRAIAIVIVTVIASKAIATATAITTVTTDSDATALFMNLAKALKRFAQISNLIAGEGSGSAIGGRIYVTVVLAVLLYGLETWVWTSSMLNSICCFHHRA